MSKQAVKKAESKADRQERIAHSMSQKAEDQKVAPAQAVGQTVATDGKVKKTKKVSTTVVQWKAQPKFAETQKIVKVQQPNPKKGKAKDRYDHYREGMTVGDYLKVTKEAKISGALAMADMRWDYVKGFIEVR